MTMNRYGWATATVDSNDKWRDGAGHNAQKLGQWREDGRREASQLVTSPWFSFVFAKERNYLKVTRDLVRASPAFYGTLVMSVLRLARGRSKEPNGRSWTLYGGIGNAIGSAWPTECHFAFLRSITTVTVTHSQHV